MDPELARFYALTAFFRSHGCCALCSIRFAIACVEAEAKRAWEPAKNYCPRECEYTARHWWAKRPRP